MSRLIMPDKPAAKVPDQVHNTCGSCDFTKAIPEDLNMLVCYGAPPTPCVVGMQNTPVGPQPAIMMARPQVARSERACAAWKRKNVLAV